MVRALSAAPCVVCGVRRELHRACSVCDVPMRHGATAPPHVICDHCRAQPENAEWSKDDRGRIGGAGDVGSEERRAAPAVSLGDLATRGHRRGRPVDQALHAHVVRLLITRQKRVRVRRRRDVRGRRDGYRWRNELMSHRDIARAAGCSHTLVNRIYAELFG